MVNNLEHLPPLGYSDHEVLRWSYVCYNDPQMSTHSNQTTNVISQLCLNQLFTGYTIQVVSISPTLEQLSTISLISIYGNTAVPYAHIWYLDCEM